MMSIANKVNFKLTQTQIEKASSVIKGRHGYAILRTQITPDVTSNESTLYTLGDQVLYQAENIHGAQADHPLVDFLRNIFLQEYWGDVENRKLVREEMTGAYFNSTATKIALRPTWSELMLDCNNIGYLVNGMKPMHDRSNGKEQAWEVPLGLYNQHVGVGNITDLVVRRIFSDSATLLPVSEVLSTEVPNDTHVRTSPIPKTVEDFYARTHIEQTFIFSIMRENGLYTYKCKNKLGLFDNPLEIIIGDNTECVSTGKPWTLMGKLDNPQYKGKKK